MVVREVKKLAAGLAWWKDRIGVDLKADLDTSPRVDVSRKGCRTVKAIFIEQLNNMKDVKVMRSAPLDEMATI